MQKYNVVDEGADKTGNHAIDSVIDDLIGKETTLIFPPGTYKLNELIVYSGVNNLRLIAPDGARLVPGQSGDSIRWIDVYSQGFVLDGFELDMRNTPVPPFVRMNYDSGDWELKRLITRGKVRAATDSNLQSGDSSEARTYFRLSAAEGTRGLLQDCYFHEGACEPTEASNRRAILVESGKGELVFNRCWFELWGENTIYAKKCEGPLRVYNCFQRNTQNGMRLGGKTEVRNCVSIKDDVHPIQAWSGGSLQRGVNAEGTNPAQPSRGISGYEGTLTIADSDFYHRYSDYSCGGAITGPTPCERIDIRNVRIDYKSKKSHDAIYTLNGRKNNGEIANLAYLQLEDIQVRNDHEYQYAVSIGQEPDEWGTVSGTLGGEGPQTDSSYVENRVTTNGNPVPANTQPPLPSPPELGQVPLQSAQVVRIDNRSNESNSPYQITAGSMVLPAGDDGATVTMDWGPEKSPVRPPNSEQASGSVPPGEVYAFYVTGGIVSTSASGPATWSVDGAQFTPGTSLTTRTIYSDQAEPEDWHQVDSRVQPTGITVAKPLSYNGEEPAHVRLQNPLDGDFEYKIEEWDYLDKAHIDESFHLLSVSPAEHKVELRDGSTYRIKAEAVSTTDKFNTSSLGNFFETETPVILTQAQTYNGSESVVTRIKDVSNDSFDVRLTEQESNTDGHLAESVGYIALEEKVGYMYDEPFEVQRTGEVVNNEWFQISFEQTYEEPRFVAGLQTFNGIDTAALRYRNLSGTGVEVKVEEAKSEDNETRHAREVVGYAVFEGATLSTRDLSSEGTTSWNTADKKMKSEQVVVGKPLSYNGSDPAHIRLRNVTDDAFDYKIEEWAYDGGWHRREFFSILSVKPGRHKLLLADGSLYRVEAGSTSATEESVTRSFDSFFGTEKPIILTQSQTANGYTPIVTRVNSVTSDSFSVMVQEEERYGTHVSETIGYIALQPGIGRINGKPFEVQREESINDQWTQIEFKQEYNSPRFLADMQTFNGQDTAGVRYRNLTASGVEVKIEEGTSGDKETRHVDEIIGYAVIEG